MNRFFVAIFLLGLGVTSGCGAPGRLIVTSAAFDAGQAIPVKYTCTGGDVSPPLKWEGAPAATKSFALICDDPDAPGGTWVHWVVFNLPPTGNSLAEDMPKDESLPNGAAQGRNSFRNFGYGGPCPPGGKAHRYFFKVYALDTTLSLPGHPGKDELLEAMRGHVLAQGQLIGTFKR